MQQEIKSYGDLLSAALNQAIAVAIDSDKTSVQFVDKKIYTDLPDGGGNVYGVLFAIVKMLHDRGWGGRPLSIEFVNCSFEGVFIIGRTKPVEAVSFQECTAIDTIEIKPDASQFVSLKECNVRCLKVLSDTSANLKLVIKGCNLNIIHAELANFKRLFELSSSAVGSSSGRQNIVFNGAIFFSGCLFSNVTFLDAPLFHGASFKQDVNFIGCDFEDTSSLASLAGYRVLRQIMSQSGSDYDVQLFHSLELRARYNVELPKWKKIFVDRQGVEKVASFVMGRLNSYGQDLWKPLYWLFVCAVIFFISYLLFGQVGCSLPETAIPKWIFGVCPQWTEVLYAVRNAFGPFGLVLSADQIQPNTVAVKILGFIHLLISSIIWFIWILQIRSRFKL